MGHRPSTLWSSFWFDEDVERWNNEQRVLFIYLLSNELASTSGVYMISRTRLSKALDIDAANLDRYLISEPMKNLSYDAHNNVVFVHNRWRYNKRGRRDLIIKGIIGDYYANPKAVHIWREFREQYRADIMNEPTLHEHFFKRVDLDGPGPIPLVLGATPLTPYSVDFADDQEREAEIQRLLNAFMDLDAGDVARIMRVVDHVGRSRSSERPLAPATRLDRVQWLSKRPVEQIARAVYLFEKADGIKGGKPFKYLQEIVDGGAAKWYREFDGERKRMEEKNGIGARKPGAAASREAQEQRGA